MPRRCCNSCSMHISGAVTCAIAVVSPGLLHRVDSGNNAASDSARVMGVMCRCVGSMQAMTKHVECLLLLIAVAWHAALPCHYV
jgi:hypothetical protein